MIMRILLSISMLAAPLCGELPPKYATGVVASDMFGATIAAEAVSMQSAHRR